MTTPFFLSVPSCSFEHMFDTDIEPETPADDFHRLASAELAAWEAEADTRRHLIPEGWKVKQLRPGVYQLTSRLGHTYMTTGP